jgi:hypothetical protein
MSSFHKNHGPMISGGCGSTFQLTITNPIGPTGPAGPAAKTARYHGLACGYSAASSDSRTELTNDATCRDGAIATAGVPGPDTQVTLPGAAPR